MIRNEYYQYPANFDANGRCTQAERFVVRCWAKIAGSSVWVLVGELDDASTQQQPA